MAASCSGAGSTTAGSRSGRTAAEPPGSQAANRANKRPGTNERIRISRPRRSSQPRRAHGRRGGDAAAVTLIQIRGFEPDAESPRVRVSWRFAGRRRFIDPGPNAKAEGENTFVGLLDLTLTGSGQWQLSCWPPALPAGFP